MFTNERYKKKVLIYGPGDLGELLCKMMPQANIKFLRDYPYSGNWFSRFCGKRVDLPDDAGDQPVIVSVMDGADRSKLAQRLYERGATVAGFRSNDAIIRGSVHDSCIILELNNIQFGAVVEPHVLMWSGNHIGHHSKIGRGTTITSHCVVSGHVEIGEFCYLGVNCTIRDGVKIAPHTVIGQGANVVKDITEPGVYAGNPAVKIKDV
jgi:hypothetical protein